MEKIIKIQSDNSIAQIYDQTQAGPSQKLVDFTIPQGGVYDLSKSYVSIKMKPVVGTNAVLDGFTPQQNVDGFLLTDATQVASHVSPPATLVRNAQFYTQNRGMAESIRRCDTLKLAQQYLEKSENDIVKSLDIVGGFNSDVGLEMLKTYYLERKVLSNGDTLLADGSNGSKVIAREHKIHLKDIFGIAQHPLYSTQIYGKTNIHLELNLDKFLFSPVQPTETGDNWASGTSHGACENQVLGAGALLTTAVVSERFDNPQLQCPFYVGMSVTVAATGLGGGALTRARQVIKDITYDAASRRVTCTFSGTAITAAGGGSNITGLTMITEQAPTATNEVLGAEIVLTEVVNPPQVPNELEYVTYTTQEDVGNGQQNVFKQYKVEPECQSLFVTHSDSGQIAPDRAFNSYRMSIDGIDVSGNRDIEYAKPIHKDRIERCYRNKSVPLKSLELKMINLTATIAAQKGDALRVIAEAMPYTEQEKNINLEIKAGAAIQDLILYKEIVKTL